jgi:hypothetical protein
MKITKRQLKRIIREEKQKLIKESYGIDDYENLVRSRRSQKSAPANNMAEAEQELEKAIYGMVANLEQVQGHSQEESHELVLDLVKQILGM